jgi:hypothetical protein
MIPGLGFGVLGFELKNSDLGLRNLGIKVKGLGFRV